MSEEHALELAAKKAFEISYALLRLAQVTKQEGFSKHFGDQALELLSLTSRGDCEEARKVLKTVERFMQLGVGVNVVHPDTSELMTKELRALDSAMIQLLNSATLPNLDLGSVFRRQARSGRSSKIGRNEVDHGKGERKTGPDAPGAGVVEFGNSAKLAEYASQARKAAILEKIRQSGNCKLSDIREALPNSSERTLRYDLQELVEEGVVERVGNVGPGTYYRLGDKDRNLILGPRDDGKTETSHAPLEDAFIA